MCYTRNWHCPSSPPIYREYIPTNFLIFHTKYIRIELICRSLPLKDGFKDEDSKGYPRNVGRDPSYLLRGGSQGFKRGCAIYHFTHEYFK